MQYLVAVIVLIALLVGGFAFLNRPLFFSIDADIAADFPAAGFSHRSFEALLERFVSSNGDVDYAAWHSSDESVAQLRSYLAAVSRFSPDATPDRFPRV